MWQDTVIALCQLAFVPATLPTIMGPEKPALTTSIANSLIVATIAVTQATLGLWLSVATAAAIFVVWATLAVQKLIISRRPVTPRSEEPRPVEADPSGS
jgi:hypothetical protein